jgi:hypothetical protein
MCPIYISMPVKQCVHLDIRYKPLQSILSGNQNDTKESVLRAQFETNVSCKRHYHKGQARGPTSAPTEVMPQLASLLE